MCQEVIFTSVRTKQYLMSSCVHHYMAFRERERYIYIITMEDIISIWTNWIWLFYTCGSFCGFSFHWFIEVMHSPTIIKPWWYFCKYFVVFIVWHIGIPFSPVADSINLSDLCKWCQSFFSLVFIMLEFVRFNSHFMMLENKMFIDEGWVSFNM